MSEDFGDLEDFEIEIYSSETSAWKHAVKPFTASIDFKYGVFWNGAINWPSDKDDSLYFNVEDEELGKMTMPPLPRIGIIGTLCTLESLMAICI